MTRLCAATLMLAVVLGLGLPAQVRPPEGLTLQTWNVGDVQRTALVALPRGNVPDAGAPLVLVFHWPSPRRDHRERRRVMLQTPPLVTFGREPRTCALLPRTRPRVQKNR